MPICFEKAITLMRKNGINSYTLKKSNMLSQGTFTSLRQNKCVTTDTIATLCKLLHCQPGDLMEYIPDEEEKELPLGEAGREAD